MLKDILNMQSSWEFLKATPLPIAVYGTGNGADKVFQEFERLGIKASGVVASDGFVRQRSFHGFDVKSISQFENEVGNFIIALAFASPLPQVIENVKLLSARHKVLMPSVPVYGDEIFNKDFLKAHLNEIEHAYSLLADEASKKVFEDIIKFQITGELEYCFRCESDKNEAFDILGLGENESFLDLGAYRGDTIEEFLNNTKSYDRIVAVEPDKRTYQKLLANCDGINGFIALNNAIWSENRTLSFDGNKGRGATAQDNAKEEISAISVDYIIDNYGKFTYLNIDVEGAEKEMLQGAINTLQQHNPKLCMAVYHRSEDIFSLINEVNIINPDYRIYLRHHPHISFWDTNLYCI